MTSATLTEQPATMSTPHCRRLFADFFLLGATAFGGPAIIAQMRRLSVVQRHWMSASEFDEGIALSQALPGATAMQCAAYAGLRLRGFRGALASFVGLGLPAFLLMLAASVGYPHAAGLLTAQATLRGLRVAVVAIVAWSALGFARTQTRTSADLIFVGLSTLLLLLGCHPVLVVGVTAVAGLLRSGQREAVPVLPPAAPIGGHLVKWVGLLMLAATCGVGVLLLTAPSLALLGLAMMKIDMVAFGGGFAALPLMQDEFVTSSAAVAASTFMDGIAFGQVTPGPIVVTATFIGYQIHGLPGAIVATAGIFFPSFTLVVAVGPWFERLQRNPRFRSATKAASLAFVGLLVSVTLRLARSLPWTTGHVLLALAALAGLRVGIKTYWIVFACGLLATLMQRFGVF